MGFFKDFKEDFQDAVDELIPGGEGDEFSEDMMINTLEDDIDINSELSKLDGLLEKAEKKVNEPAPEPEEKEPVMLDFDTDTEEPEDIAVEPESKEEPIETKQEEIKEQTIMDSTPISENIFTQSESVAPAPAPAAPQAVSDENAVITAGMTINGDLESIGSIEVQGLIKGNVTCNGKLVVTGTIRGNSNAAEFFADAAKIEGEVATSGTAKVGAGSVIIGNISASSAVIAGAVKGDIDVQGPVVVDTSAVVMGNIKSRSVQINNGAVIEGFCSQAYAEVDVDRVFQMNE